jgi:hypothetical protein
MLEALQELLVQVPLQPAQRQVEAPDSVLPGQDLA